MASPNCTREEIFSQLNTQQIKATSFGDQPLLIIAGAGTGKTTTLAHRVAHLILEGIDPSRILLLTFTRRSASELLRRVEGILNQLELGDALSECKQFSSVTRNIWGGTFHAVAARLLRKYGRLIGLTSDFTILDSSDSEDLMNSLRTELSFSSAENRFPLKSTCMGIYGRCVNAQLSLAEVLAQFYPWCAEHEEGLKKLFQSYVDRKEHEMLLDYDDLLIFWHGLISEPGTAKLIQDKFDYILVDEYQDTNLLQAEILKQLTPAGKGLTVVGDDAQSIYSFRSATVRNILDFPSQFPGTTLIPLEQNYRSTQSILSATNLVIAQAAERHEKELWSDRITGEPPGIVDCQDEEEQAEFIIQRVLNQREEGVLLKEQAVLFRASHHCMSLEVELNRRKIPFHKYGGLKFVETAHIKDLLAYLKLVENVRDSVSGVRVLSLLPGIGPKKAKSLLDVLQATGDFSVWKEFSPPAATRELWPNFLQLMQQLQNHSQSDITAEIHLIRKFYTPLLEQLYDHPKVRLRDLEQLELVSSRYPDRRTFLEEMSLDPPSSTQEIMDSSLDEDDFLVLSTIHSAKGLEWESIYLLQATDGCIPSDKALDSKTEIEEERRLFYVALTRAKNELFVCYPRRLYYRPRMMAARHGYTPLSRFLPTAVQQKFQRFPAFQTEALDQPVGNQQASISSATIRNRMKKMW